MLRIVDWFNKYHNYMTQYKWAGPSSGWALEVQAQPKIYFSLKILFTLGLTQVQLKLDQKEEMARNWISPYLSGPNGRVSSRLGLIDSHTRYQDWPYIFFNGLSIMVPMNDKYYINKKNPLQLIV